MDYILKISGEFEKGECGKCPASYHLKGYCNGEAIAWEKFCLFGCDANTCPLEEAEQGEWIDNIVERLEAATDSVYNEVKGDYFDYIKSADAIEIVKGSKDEGNTI